MKELYRSSALTSNYFPAMVGDLDKDGNAEIVIPAIEGSAHPSYSKIYILNHIGQVKHTITLPTGSSLHMYQCPMIGDFDNDGYGEIAVPTNIGTPKLLIYKHDGTKLAEISVAQGLPRITGMADFNRDGYPEIYVGTSIYQYKNGNLTQLIGGNPTLNTVAQDIDKDGIPELVATNAIYKVNLAAGTVVEFKKCTAITDITNFFALADIDLDGQIEVVSLTADLGVGANKKITVTVWNPVTGSVKYSISTAVITVATGRAMGTSWPFIGDTDSNLYPDIVFMGGSNETGKTYVYRIEYNGSSGLVIRKSDNNFIDYSSRCTSMSMFDFNNDGANEIVYRDEKNLYILDGGNTNGTLFKKLKTIDKNESGTGWEYPVVASLTSSGESYVIMNSGTSQEYWKGTLRIYGADLAVAGSKPWAMSRPVWNQFAFYQNTIDDNLKVIAHPLPLNYKMIASDGVKQFYPFNGHMMQRGIINEATLEFFTPIADLVVTAVNYDHNTVNNEMIIRVSLANEGDAGMDPPIPIKVYKTVGGTRSLVKTQNFTEAIAVGIIKVVSITIPNYSSLGDVQKIDIEVEIPTGQYDCRPGNNSGSEVPNLKAVDDNAQTNVTVPVITNDVLGDCTSTTIEVSVIGTPTKGTAAVSDKQIVYTPMANNIGGASFNYKITCEGNTSTAKVSVGTKSTIKAEFVKHASEPTIAGEIKLRFNENSTTCDYPVKVTYKITSPPGLVNGTHYTISPASPATIPVGESGVLLKIIPIDNFVVESTRGAIEIEITNVEMQTP